MKTARCVLVALMALAFAWSPSQADDRGALAFELSALRDAWLHGDNATAAARLDTLRKDNRLSGEFPRWYASLRAALALQDGNAALAREIMQPTLDESSDARNYLRTARLFIAYGEPDSALEIIRDGLKRAPNSPALRRFEAGLLWLGGDHDAALERYVELIAESKTASYPYVRPPASRWSEARPWNAVDGARREGSNEDKELERWLGAPAPDAGNFKPEPYVSLFLPAHWFPSDLPGLDRCVLEVAGDETLGAAWAARRADLIAAARQVQSELDNLRSGDSEQRAGLERKAAAARTRAVIASRIAARRQLATDALEECETTLREGLELNSDDVALLDLQLQLYGRQGRAEAARTGPLSRLRAIAGISIYPSTVYSRSYYAEVLDRVFMPALTLYRANPEAGRLQFDETRAGFGDSSRNQPVHPGALGLWLYKQGETEYARTLLMEASRLNGYESGRPLYEDAIYFEVALLALGEGQPDSAERPAPAPGGDEADPVEVARLDADTNPLLRQSLRVGAVMGAVHDPRERIRTYAGVDLWGSFAGFDSVVGAAGYTGDENLLSDKLFNLHRTIASEVPQAELRAMLDPSHTTSATLKQTLDSLSESLQSLRANNNWNVRRTISQQVGPVFGMVEARAILLRARLLQDKPSTLKEVAAWLETHQPEIDLRRRLGAQPNDIHTRFSEARAAAGIPEITHKGLALDAAGLLAGAGAYREAALLLWHNRDALSGVESTQRMLALAAVYAQKAGDAGLATRCRVTGAGALPNPLIPSGTSRTLLIAELPAARAELIEAGGDVLAYLEGNLLPTASVYEMQRINVAVPELAEAPAGLLQRDSLGFGVERFFESSVSSGSCQSIWLGWEKLKAAESPATIHRIAAWVIASDLPLGHFRGYHNGLCAPEDAVGAWALLQQAYAMQAANSADALKSRDRLTKLLNRTAAQPGQKFNIYSDWWM